jgi:RNA recognition motif-containing protein
VSPPPAAPIEELANPRPAHVSPAPKVAGYDVAYVGNIAYEADEAAVRALFEPYGVTKVRIHTDKDTGRPKGFAHIHFE